MNRSHIQALKAACLAGNLREAKLAAQELKMETIVAEGGPSFGDVCGSGSKELAAWYYGECGLGPEAISNDNYDAIRRTCVACAPELLEWLISELRSTEESILETQAIQSCARECIRIACFTPAYIGIAVSAAHNITAALVSTFKLTKSDFLAHAFYAAAAAGRTDILAWAVLRFGITNAEVAEAVGGRALVGRTVQWLKRRKIKDDAGASHIVEHAID